MLMCTPHKGVKSLLIEWKNEQKSDSVRDTFLNTYIYCSIDAMKGMLGKKKKRNRPVLASKHTPSAFSSVVCNYNEY